jgi:hypothetical protein
MEGLKDTISPLCFPFLHFVHVWWVTCHRGKARPQVADRGEGLQVRRVAANIWNKQSGTANKEWSPSLGVGHGANNPSA